MPVERPDESRSAAFAASVNAHTGGVEFKPNKLSAGDGLGGTKEWYALHANLETGHSLHLNKDYDTENGVKLTVFDETQMDKRAETLGGITQAYGHVIEDMGPEHVGRRVGQIMRSQEFMQSMQKSMSLRKADDDTFDAEHSAAYQSPGKPGWNSTRLDPGVKRNPYWD